MGLMETGMAWFWSDARVKKWFDVKGIENLTSTTRGVMVAGIHFMSLELCGRVRGLWFVRMTQQGGKCRHTAISASFTASFSLAAIARQHVI